WQMKFNVSKCKVLHVGKNVRFEYTMGSRKMESMPYEKDSGVIFVTLCSSCPRPSMVESTPMAKVAVLNPEMLKPMKKRKRKEYLSPSDEESEMETMVGTMKVSPEELKKEDWVWSAYLEDQKSIAAPLKLFHEVTFLMENNFKVGMKLEGIDPQHPSMYFVLTVAEVCGYRIRLHFDGYSDCHDFWVNANSPDIHWAGWCERTGHKLYTPKAGGCGPHEPLTHLCCYSD
uniref:Uncharacterized protein n=1 Tax=Erpetoichthys calabaricus TaxID=27687 RepID=A0A8C4SL26_ERPCA